MKLLQRITVTWLMVALLGCAALGLAPADTFNKRVAVALVTVTGARTTALTLLTAKVITADDAKNVQDQADVARKGIDVAQQIHATDPKTGDARLTAAVTGLTAVKAYLCLKQPTDPLCAVQP